MKPMGTRTYCRNCGRELRITIGLTLRPSVSSGWFCPHCLTELIKDDSSVASTSPLGSDKNGP